VRRRFYLTIVSVLLFSVTAASLTQFFVFRRERDRLIDEQVTALATTLLSSDFPEAELGDLEEAETLLEDELGAARVSAVVRVLSVDTGLLLYRSRNSEILEDFDVPAVPGWSTVRAGEHELRFLSARHPASGRLVQVGVLLDRGKVQWRNASWKVGVSLALIALFVVGMALLLGALLLAPLRALAGHVGQISASVGLREGPTELPPGLAKGGRRGDEFAELVRAVAELGGKLNARFRVNRASAAQMAHELKTPLTIVRNSLEGLLLDPRFKAEAAWRRSAEDALDETDRLTRVIQDFLDWARIEAAVVAREGLHAIRLGAFASQTEGRLGKVYGERLCVEAAEDPLVFARPDLLEQCVRNLADNALKHSVGEVVLRVNGRRLEVLDRGPGVPAKVIERLGEPFNAGPESERGSGLGLARVSAIARLYGWDFRLLPREGGGTVASLEFPEES
jgi:two-component system sensor histidine kinase QseC